MAEKNTIKPVMNNNNRVLTIYAEICLSWGFKDKSSRLKNSLLKELSERGFTINYQINPLNDKNLTYNVYLGYKIKDNLIFSNDKHLRDEVGCVYGNFIDKYNSRSIIDYIENMI